MFSLIVGPVLAPAAPALSAFAATSVQFFCCFIMCNAIFHSFTPLQRAKLLNTVKTQCSAQ